jgi:hypothetical protein
VFRYQFLPADKVGDEIPGYCDLRNKWPHAAAVSRTRIDVEMEPDACTVTRKFQKEIWRAPSENGYSCCCLAAAVILMRQWFRE